MSTPLPTIPRRDFIGRLLAGLTAWAWFIRPTTAQAAPDGSDSPYIGEIRMFAGNFAPTDWQFCNGQLLAISGNEALFSLIGTTYGGNGTTTFGLPDLRGRAPMLAGAGFTLGQIGGSETVTLASTQIPSHTHAAGASTLVATSDLPGGRLPAVNAAGVPMFAPTADTSLAAAALLSTGGSQPHNNMQPSLAIHFIISLFGVYPSQT